MGLAQRDARGFRLRPDGKTLSLTIDMSFASDADYMELVKKYWQAVGIETNLNLGERAFIRLRKANNEHDVGIWGIEGGIDAILEAYWYIPVGSFGMAAVWAHPWAEWYESRGAQGEEPLPWARQQQELYDQILATADPAKQRQLMLAALDLAAENFYAIGLSTAVPGYGIQRNDFFNVPKRIISSAEYPHPAPTNPAQYFTTRR
jgi:peptide/nickel transport system substrate-binding protein